MEEKTTEQLKKAIKEFQDKGFYLDEYQTEKENIRQYKNDLIRELNTFKIKDVPRWENLYTFEEAGKLIKEWFKDSKIKKIKELDSHFLNIDRDVFSYDLIGWNENLRLSFDEFYIFVSDYLKSKKAITIKRFIYNSYNIERDAQEIKEEFKQYVELALNLKCSEDDFKFNVYKEHVKFTLTDDKLISVYCEKLRSHLLSFFTRPVYFKIDDLKNVLELTRKKRFILVTDKAIKKQVAYLYLDYYAYNIVKDLEINKPDDYNINADLNGGDFKRFSDFNSMVGYSERSEDYPLTENTKGTLKALYDSGVMA